MKLRLHRILAFALLSVLFFQACKEEEETKEHMNGSISMDYSMPPYVRPGEKYSFSPSGITAPDGTDVMYYFTAPVTNVKDTLKDGRKTFMYEVPDTLGTFSLYCTAYPVQSSDKYYVSTASVTFVIVSDAFGRGSVSDIIHGLDETVEVLDGRQYYVRNLGGQKWLGSNLAIIDRDSEEKEIFGRSYMSSPAMQYVFGGYYTWNEARKACPSGWHLPTDAEWVQLLKTVGAPAALEPLKDSPCGAGKLMCKARFNKTIMWDYYREVDINDVSISALPVGYADITGGKYSFKGYSDYAVFWTADEFEGKGVYRYIFEQYDNVFVGTADKDAFAASVRCIR